MKKIKIVGRKNSTVLVEWVEESKLFRSFVPLESTKEVGSEVFCDNPEQGIPYGVPWSLVVDREVDVELFEAEMHKQGIWTIEDFERNPQKVSGCLRKVMAQTVGSIRRNLLNYQGE